MAVSSSEGIRQFANDDEGSQAVRYIVRLKPTRIVIEAIGRLEMTLAVALQAGRLPVVVINPRQWPYGMYLRVWEVDYYT